MLHSCISNTVNEFEMERNAAQHHMRAWSTELKVGMTASQRGEGTCTAVLPQKFLVILQRSVLHSKMCF